MSWADSWGSSGGFIPDSELRKFRGVTIASTAEALDTASREIRGTIELVARSGLRPWVRFSPDDRAHGRVMWRADQSLKPVWSGYGQARGLVMRTGGMEILASSEPGSFASLVDLQLQHRGGTVRGHLPDVVLWSRIPLGTPAQKIQIPTALSKQATNEEE